MRTSAVTQDAPAVSERPTFLPTDRNYRMTGQLADTEEPPAVSREEEIKPSEPEASAPPEPSETAAASEAAPQQEKPQQKTAQTSESRWAKITRENRELRDRLARLEGAQSAREPQRETQQASQPAQADGKPKPGDIDPKTNQPKYKTWAEYEDARDEWNRKEAVRMAKEDWDKTTKAQALEQAEQRINQEINKRVEQARKDHLDYDEVVDSLLALKHQDGRDVIYFPKGSAVDMFFAESPKSQDIFYEIGKDPNKYAEIFATDAQGKFLMHPVRQLRLLAQIEHSLSAPKTEATPAKPITAAPRPPHQTSGKGTVAKDAVAQAVEEGDSSAYIAEANARQLARLKKGK